MPSLEEIARELGFGLINGVPFIATGDFSDIICGISIHLNSDRQPYTGYTIDGVAIPPLIINCADIKPGIIRNGAAQFGESLSDVLYWEVDLHHGLRRAKERGDDVSNSEAWLRAEPKTPDEKLEHLMKVVAENIYNIAPSSYPGPNVGIYKNIFKLLSPNECGKFLLAAVSELDAGEDGFPGYSAESACRQFGHYVAAYVASGVRAELPPIPEEAGGRGIKLTKLLYFAEKLPANAIERLARNIWFLGEKMTEIFSSAEFADSIEKNPRIQEKIVHGFGNLPFKEAVCSTKDLAGICLSDQFASLTAALPDGFANEVAENTLEVAAFGGASLAYSLIDLAKKYAAKPVVAAEISVSVNAGREESVGLMDFYNSQQFGEFISSAAKIPEGVARDIGRTCSRLGKDSALSLMGLLRRFEGAPTVMKQITEILEPRYYPDVLYGVGVDSSRFANLIEVFSSKEFNKALIFNAKYAGEITKRVGEATYAGRDVGMKLTGILSRELHSNMCASNLNIAEWVAVVAKNEGRDRALEIIVKYEAKYKK